MKQVPAIASFALPLLSGVDARPRPVAVEMAGTNDVHRHTGESRDRQILVICLCVVYFCALVLQQCLRYCRMRGKVRKSSFVEILLHIQFFTTIAIILSVVLLEAGLAMVTDSQCHAASVVCILLFGLSKSALYMVFNERVHDLRVPSVQRLRDPVWITCSLCVAAGVAASIFLAAVAPLAHLERRTGQCNIRLTQGAVITFSTFLLAVGIYLTCMFICILLSALRSHRATVSTVSPTCTKCPTSFVSISRRGTLPTHEQDRKCNSGTLCKDLAGWVAMLSFTLINSTIYHTWDGAKRSHICLLSCLTDVAWSMFITSWLITNTREEAIRYKSERPISLNRLSKDSALPIADINTVPAPQNIASDSWTKYMDTLSRERHKNFSMDFYEAKEQTDSARLGVLPELPGEDCVRPA